MHHQPTTKTLFIAWLALMAFSVSMMFSGQVTSQGSLGIVFAFVLLVITGLKASWILQYYLNLNASGRGWINAFRTFLFILLTLIFLIFALG